MKEESIFPIIGAERKLPIYITGIGWHANQFTIQRKTGFPKFQVIYCSRGSGILRVGSAEYEITNEQAFFLYPNEAHVYYPKEEPWETRWLTFEGDDIQNLVRSLGFTKSRAFYLSNYPALDDMWRQIILEAKSSQNDKGFRCSALAYSFLILLKSLVSEEPILLKDEKLAKLNTVLQYIDKNFNRDLGMEELVACINISPQYLCKLFQKYLNMRPFEYVTRKRIQEAKSLLLEENIPEADIAEQCGFNSLSYFCTSFKHLENITPAEFRKLQLSE